MFVEGSCLCGGVAFEVELPFRRANVCHCSRCRKHSGGPGLVQGRVPRERFRLLCGGELVRTYRPEGGKVKAFCSVCGSSLFGGDWRAVYDRRLMDDLCRDLAARGWAAWNLEYRRLGEGGGWPATFDDVDAGIGAIGASNTLLLALGHSAGGHLALWA